MPGAIPKLPPNIISISKNDYKSYNFQISKSYLTLDNLKNFWYNIFRKFLKTFAQKYYWDRIFERREQEMNLDYSITDPQKRKAIVDDILKKNPNPSKQYLEILSDYIIFAMTKDEKKSHKILTDNRMVTVNKRETSYQGLVGKLENGEDGLYHLLGSNSKNVILTPKVSITAADLVEVPGLQQLKNEIEHLKKIEPTTSGKNRYIIKKAIIELSQDQYIIKNSYRAPITPQTLTRSDSSIDLTENYYIDDDKNIHSDGLVTLLNPAHVSALLCNYASLNAGTVGEDFTDLVNELTTLIDRTLKEDYPYLYDLLWYKVGGLRNVDIRLLLEQKHGYTYSVEYLSALWRKKIPKLIAEKAQEDALIWYYTEIERGKWKRCSRCGEVKLAHSRFFSRNKSAYDGWYSVCKCCRNKKRLGKTN